MACRPSPWLRGVARPRGRPPWGGAARWSSSTPPLRAGMASDLKVRPGEDRFGWILPVPGVSRLVNGCCACTTWRVSILVDTPDIAWGGLQESPRERHGQRSGADRCTPFDPAMACSRFSPAPASDANLAEAARRPADESAAAQRSDAEGRFRGLTPSVVANRGVKLPQANAVSPSPAAHDALILIRPEATRRRLGSRIGIQKA